MNERKVMRAFLEFLELGTEAARIEREREEKMAALWKRAEKPLATMRAEFRTLAAEPPSAPTSRRN